MWCTSSCLMWTNSLNKTMKSGPSRA
ncbi:unnamed protein product [Medioppia subpectinata]|uniref:Uncharacterized protein n=1 Tax=Medioppia subpectinata TaxID=1979941 RepID=A0A7R9KM41_9ACAR|nr:unnamed protein product [Medioppia subpectinata]CAG2106141.1 unnamed protein product [Medioppia subpectinata]